MKNLLACYANCRYNLRCGDLRNEVLDKLHEASRDINQYLGECSASPITIQVLKRGLRFAELQTSSAQDQGGLSLYQSNLCKKRGKRKQLCR
jgi:hypothetical protein